MGGTDRVLPATRWLSIVIIPFLLAGFVDLYFWPSETGRNFAWKIVPNLTPMILASLYLGGSYFFLRAATARRWHEIKAGFIPVATFASMLGIATVIHWEKFLHDHWAFWVWAALYFTTPFLVIGAWLYNRPEDVPPDPGEVLVPDWARTVIGIIGLGAVVTSAFLFLFPVRAIAVWPWLLTPLTSRVMGAVFALGIAAVGAFTEARWSSYRLMMQVAAIMLGLIAVAVVRAHDEFHTSRPLTWVLLVGFVAVAVGAVWLAVTCSRGSRSLGTPAQAASARP